MKRIKLTETQIEMIQSRLKPKSIKLTEEQFNRIFDTEESRQSFNEAMAKYVPQTEKENKKTFKSFNESVDGLTIDAFVDKFKVMIKDLMKGDYSSTEALANELGVTKDDVISEIISLGIGEFSKDGLNYIRFRRDEIKNNFKTLFKHLVGKKETVSMGGDMELTEEAPANPKLSCVYMNKEIAILVDGVNSYYFYYGDMDVNNDFADYADREIEDTTIGDKGDPGEIFHSYADVIVDEEVIENYVNANLDNMSKGVGVEGAGDGKDIVKIDKALANEILNLYSEDADKITGALMSIEETTSAGSVGGSFVAPIKMEEGQEVPKITMFSDEEGIECKKQEEDELDEATTTASVGGSYVAPAIWAKSKKDHVPSKKPQYQGGQIVESKEGAKLYVRIKKAGFEPGVDYVMSNNTIWASDFDTATEIADAMADFYGVTIDDEHTNQYGNVPMFFGKPEGKQAELQFPVDESKTGGQFVKFDDCTKLNNNKDAQNGGCSQGAVDKVVKTFETICREISEECGKPMSEVKTVLLKNKLHESTDNYYDYMWIDLGIPEREAEEIKYYLEDTNIDGDTYEYMRTEYGINDVDLDNIINILGL